eukprot:CAMPEP_0197590420 /NCGR_PEP_ID=MMETSP1326-20131121/11023_1 /TAXON_ID=1155430 /ORGANISM="Genus nov. species nov., Strain RCC2288" /LENGTH=134 /DNA_ID=CAMNT_0043155449 /DNA_START=70 /DNA_END=470 /DNA_ORIENTATION=+
MAHMLMDLLEEGMNMPRLGPEELRRKLDLHISKIKRLKETALKGFPLPDYDSVPAAEKEGLRAWFRPGRLWTGEISIPGGAMANRAKYIFQVIEWSHTAGCWIVSHAAHGDEQLCHLKIEEDKEGSSGGGGGGG